MRIACRITALLLLVVFSGCTTYYQKTLQYQSYVQEARFDKAKQWLQKDKKGKRPRNRVLHELNVGWVNWITGQADSSNAAFAKADVLIEDRQVNAGLEALAVVSNPGVRHYVPEDFELVLVNYYKALNYISLGQLEAALVECRKINIKLNQLNDKYKDKKNRYSTDAFAHLLMGLVYEASGDDNNAFIAYRNAYEAYESVYRENFGVTVPGQLKHDLIRSAWRCGFVQEARQYEETFGLKYMAPPKDRQELVFLWHNGFGPVKDEWSLNFSKLDRGDGFITLADEGSGISFPYATESMSASEKSAFSDVHFLRIAFPKYIERPPRYYTAEIRVNSQAYPLQMAQNINEIAFKTLQDRMLRELGSALLRLAVKQGMEASLKSSKKEDMQNLGTAVSLVNALTEKADTRNWQTLPYSISYCRVPLEADSNQLRLLLNDGTTLKEEHFEFNASTRRTQFFFYSTLDLK